ncbi:MAG: DUF2076 domain-containing protein [Pigmentiphaga sp.]|jgi:hypothetical protein|uniref:DUF2076 domain-containing protein n=1 Tax=Pigmentiphaga daeguensis TaxID=414049 RepID=A0ABP3MAW9_9BURK
MTPQERALLDNFLDRLAGVRGMDKDPEADALIRHRAAGQPDALYLSIQRALLLEHALEGAQARIAALEQQVGELQAASRQQQEARPARSFLGGLLGGDGWGKAPARPAPAGGSMIGSDIGQRPEYRPAAPAAPYAGAPAAGGAMGSFLGNAAATAAGVAGGMFLFNGIEHLLGGGAGQAAHLAGNAPASETITQNVTNNYYGSGNDDRPDTDGGAQAYDTSADDSFTDDTFSDDTFSDDDFV